MAHITPPSEVEQLRRRVAELEQALASRRWGRRIAPADTPDAPTEPVEPSAPDADTPALWPEDEQRALADAFHRLWYDRRDRTWTDTHFLGAQLLKLPLDLWVYQELVWRIRPTVFVETGTFMGGSALYFASLFDLIGEGRVVSVDIEHAGPVPEHPRVDYLIGSSVAEDTLDQVRARIGPDDTVMVLLDSDHSADHVLAELEAYHGFVTPGSYLIVEDSNINGHPVLSSFGPGPMEALEAFFPGRDDFEHDPWCERYMMSFATKGFWRRTSPEDPSR